MINLPSSYYALLYSFVIVQVQRISTLQKQNKTKQNKTEYTVL